MGKATFVSKLRKALGLSQEELGKRVGVSGSSVSLWEDGKRNPSKSAMILLKKEAAQKLRVAE